MSERTIQPASTLTASTSRRGALRLLAGLALAGSGLAALNAADADAKSKNKNKRKGKKETKRSNRVRVPHDGTIVYTEKLEAGKRYRLRVSGFLRGSGPLLPSAGVDAGYIFRPDGDPSLARDVYAGIDFGLSVDGAAADWGPHRTDHVYTREVVGAGERLALRMITASEESLSQSAENEPSTRRVIEINPNLTVSGSLTVEVRPV